MVYEDESSNDLSSLDISSSSDGMMYQEICRAIVRPRVASHNAKCIVKLWEMLEDSKSARRDDNLENSLKIHHLTEEKRNLDANYDKLVEDVNQLLNLGEAQGGVIRTQKANHLKEKDKLNDEILVLNLHIDGLKKGIENLIKRRDEVKIQIADQLKALEKNQEKLKMIRDILDG
ncbi:Anthocyanin 3'-O-beta-glucosyltransferase [Hordeum vulgare]|nr:Anthocyanin 3'-O-beta-glucosyltransferase [Hordeum vulgare]